LESKELMQREVRGFLNEFYLRRGFFSDIEGGKFFEEMKFESSIS